MIALVDLIDGRDTRAALEYDLLRCGSRLRDFPDGGVSWRDLLVLVQQAQPDSALFKVLNQHWQATPELELLRAVEHDLRVLSWQKTKDAQHGRNYPAPLPFPWDPPAADRPDSFEWDEAAERFGWGIPMTA